MKSGELRHRVTFEAWAVATDSSGEPIVDPDSGERTHAWTQAGGKSWAKIAPASGREFIESQAKQSAVTTKITIRHRADINAGMRCSHNGARYNVEAVMPDPDSGLEHLVLLCSVGVSDGQ